MNASNVKEVVGVATKKDGSELRGTGSKGEWVMYSVILDNGTKMNVFGPVSVGDTVYDLVQDEQYHNWKGKVKKAGTAPRVDSSQPTNAQIMNAILDLRLLMENKIVKKPMPVKKVEDTILKDIEEGESVDLIDIPF